MQQLVSQYILAGNSLNRWGNIQTVTAGADNLTQHCCVYAQQLLIMSIRLAATARQVDMG